MEEESNGKIGEKQTLGISNGLNSKREMSNIRVGGIDLAKCYFGLE